MTQNQASGGGAFIAILDRLISASDLTQREIADNLGYEHPNIISMFKKGTTRVPLDKVPNLADVLDVDRAWLVNLWLEQYAPELKRVIDENVGMPLSAVERSWIVRLRRLYPGGLPPWDKTVDRYIAALVTSGRDAKPNQ